MSTYHQGSSALYVVFFCALLVAFVDRVTAFWYDSEVHYFRRHPEDVSLSGCFCSVRKDYYLSGTANSDIG